MINAFNLSELQSYILSKAVKYGYDIYLLSNSDKILLTKTIKTEILEKANKKKSFWDFLILISFYINCQNQKPTPAFSQCSLIFNTHSKSHNRASRLVSPPTVTLLRHVYIFINYQKYFKL
ncbi:MAG: hypothetical protein FWG98_10575 [Candidatus Cloacimonetes bacterium]|nr:hypothetical protein [Candidatus Cloacimonadota bacterium]